LEGKIRLKLKKKKYYTNSSAKKKPLHSEIERKKMIKKSNQFVNNGKIAWLRGHPTSTTTTTAKKNYNLLLK